MRIGPVVMILFALGCVYAMYMIAITFFNSLFMGYVIVVCFIVSVWFECGLIGPTIRREIRKLVNGNGSSPRV